MPWSSKMWRDDSPRRFLFLNSVSSCSTCLALFFLCLISETPETSQFLYQAAGLGPTGLTSVEGMLQIGIFIAMLPCVPILPELMLKFVAVKCSQIHLNNCMEFAWGLTLCFDLLCWMSFFLLNPLVGFQGVRLDVSNFFWWMGPARFAPCGTHRSMGPQLAEAGWGMMFQPKQSKKSKGKSNLFWGGCRVQSISVIFVLEFVCDQCYRDFYLTAFNKSNQTENPIPFV